MKLFFYLCLLLGAASGLMGLSCEDNCNDTPSKEYVLLSQSYKDSICHFNPGIQWIFKSDGGDNDTATTRKIVYDLSEGDCITGGRRRDCCGKRFYEDVKLNLVFSGNDDLDKISSIGLSNSSFQTYNRAQVLYDFKHDTPLSIIIDGVMLEDVFLWSASPHDNFPDKVYWSISKGLVRYEYTLPNNSQIYERTDL